ncbi:MAG TPA: DUF4097 family beta strand repeat-containing protein [Dehalococcoidia bacterium]|nr:DUF4097 family beta strand repeat-containing protein [Dehalococcoidia bacterium]
MSMRYAIPEGGRLKLLSGSGSVHVIAEARDDVEIDQPRAHVEVRDDHVLEVRSKSGSVTARCPTGARVSVGVISGSVRLEGEFGSVKVSAISGSIHVDQVQGDVDIRSVSGSLTLESCGGNCSMNTKSGRITVGEVGKGLQAATISGTIEGATAGQGAVEVKSISGSVSLQVPEGRHPHAKFKTLSGRVRCDCPAGEDFDLKVTTLSGSIEITKA